MSKVLNSILDFLFPSFCPVCHEKSLKDGALCRACLEKYSEEQKETCPVCGRTASDCVCDMANISRTFIGGKRFVALTFYRGWDPSSTRVTEKIIYPFKRKYDKSLTDFFARNVSAKLMKLMKKDGEDPAGWYLTYPPRSPENIRKYGFDQCESTVKRISRLTGIPWGKTLVRSESEEQKGLDRSGRRANATALKLKKNARVEGKRIILFDDIITTGATVKAATAELMGAGAECVFPVCIARTKAKRQKKGFKS